MFVSSKLGLVCTVVAMASVAVAGMNFDELDPPIGEGEVQLLWSITTPDEDSVHDADKPISVSGTRVKNQDGKLRIFSIDGASETKRYERDIARSSTVKTWTKKAKPDGGLTHWPTTVANHPYVIRLYSKNPNGGFDEEDFRGIKVTL